MKKWFLVLAVLLSFPCAIRGAEYLGKDVDGNSYDCTAFSYSTSNYYNVSVEFSGDEAIVTFDHGGFITLTLDDEVIEDPTDISAYDPNDGSMWQLEIDDL